MKKKISLIVMSCLLVFSLAACGSSNSSDAVAEATTEAHIPSDVDFVVNMGKGLEARWKLTNAPEAADIDTKSVAEQQKAFSSYVNAELEQIGSIDDYEFKDDACKAIAEQYMKGLELQKQGIPYVGTEDYTNYNKTHELGRLYRAAAIYDMYTNYGLTVSEEYQSTLDDFIAESTTAKKSIAVQEYVNELADKIEYKKDKDKSDEWSTYYKAVIENTTEYEIDSLTITIDFYDESGVVIDQGSDYINNLQPGKKYQSEIYHDPSLGDVDSTSVTIEYYVE